MKTLFPQPKTADQARRQANILDRAKKLVEQGYQIKQRTRPTLYGIYKPENVKPVRGVWRSDYFVDMTPGFEFCSCPSFKKDGDCKHRLAIVIEDEQIDAMFQEWGGDERAWIEDLI